MELICEIKTYEWGKFGLDSKVAKLAATSCNLKNVEPSTPYAELWMGTHPSGPSIFKASGLSLGEVISKNPHFLGEPIRQIFGDQDLPFLFKVLSVNKALSIQAHPSKQHAQQLHSERPDLYKDPNHKPELAIALTQFEALCGFRPFSEIRTFVKEVKELRAIIDTDLAERVITHDSDEGAENLIRECFAALITTPENRIAEFLQQVLKKFDDFTTEERNKFLAPLIERLHADFPGDVGCFAVYFLNLVRLQPNDALYLGANVPHAYLSGDCIECMSCSDNVVRAGLTPKFKDVDTLCKMLDYRPLLPDLILFKPVVENEQCVVYRPPIVDFAVAKHEVPSQLEEYHLTPRNSASILLVVAGFGESDSIKLSSGTVLFLSANEEMRIQVTNDLLMFQAMINLEYKN